MADSDKETAAMIPSWQRAASTAALGDNSSSHTAVGGHSTLERARTFLQDETVILSSREKKIEFLKSKGIEETDIHKLLDEAEEATTAQATTNNTTITKGEGQAGGSSPSNKAIVASTPESKPEQQNQHQHQHQHQQDNRSDHPPIITYPEFLTKPAKPPPLITASGLLNSLGIVAGLSALVYGATKHLVSPMVETLNEARADFHDNANKNLSRLVEQLENAVSEIPASYHAVGKNTPEAHNTNKLLEDGPCYNDDSSSSYDDPTELFHRDVGVQTSPPATPDVPSHTGGWPSGNPNNNNSNKPGSNPQQEADKLNNIISSVRGLSSTLVSQAEDLVETKNVLDQFNQDLHSLTYPPESFGFGSSYLYGTVAAARAEPDDEVKRVKNSIRSVKGVLLSTRSFPPVTR
ncbi:hypothetical protein VM1G_03273 [Cytospora mali]|uniref:Peroxisomal membrane protein PEX14 n=1 Tax=Cytospora mali TaxID=578113 RepID=A0A194VVN2_CYTMA|nr:hypothetical protein VM1G_03273 [Valsa mali]